MTDHLLLTGPLHHYRASFRAHAAGDVPVAIARLLGEIRAPSLVSARIVAELMAARIAPPAYGWNVEVAVEEVGDVE